MLSDERGAAHVRLLLAGAGAVAIALGLLHRGDAPPPAHVTVLPPPPRPVPAGMVGVWTSTRGGTMRCIELHRDGRYEMVPNTAAGDTFVAATGSWRVGDQAITWRDDSQGDQADTNRMVDVDERHFSTLEADGSRTKFELIAPTVTARCPR